MPAAPSEHGGWFDFAHLKAQLPLARVPDHLGLSAPLKGNGPQRHGPCPIHRVYGRGCSLSVHLEQNVYQCFDATRQSKGDLIDLWAVLHYRDLRAAVPDRARTFGLEPAPAAGTEMRNG